MQIGSPKTSRSRRTVALDPGTVAVLRTHRRAQAAERLQIGAGWKDHDLIFCKVDGVPLHPERVSREFDRRVQRWDLPKLTLHGLRHTWATLALSSGVHPKVVQDGSGIRPSGPRCRSTATSPRGCNRKRPGRWRNSSCDHPVTNGRHGATKPLP